MLQALPNTKHSQNRSTALALIERVLDKSPDVAATALHSDTRFTGRWRHGALHDSLPAMPGNVIMTYYSQPRDIIWQSGQKRLVSTTRPGSITVIPDGVDGRWDISDDIEVSHVYLSHERLQACADPLTDGKSIELIGRVGFADPTSARILEILAREASNEDVSSRLFVEQALDLLCTQLVRGHSTYGTLTQPEPQRGLANWQVRRVTAYMKENIAEEIGLNELAAIAGLSRYHFCVAFRLATGQTPHGWLTRERIEYASKLLATTRMSVTDVALSVGYSTPSAFTASFRKLRGITPSQFRLRL